MDKKIPKLFANKVQSNGNNERVYHSNDKDIDIDEISSKNFYDKNINQKINDIFNSSSYVYKADVLIKFKNESIIKRIVGRNSTHLITIDNELIPISDIIDIKRK